MDEAFTSYGIDRQCSPAYRAFWGPMAEAMAKPMGPPTAFFIPYDSLGACTFQEVVHVPSGTFWCRTCGVPQHLHFPWGSPWGRLQNMFAPIAHLMRLVMGRLEVHGTSRGSAHGIVHRTTHWVSGMRWDGSAQSLWDGQQRYIP